MSTTVVYVIVEEDYTDGFSGRTIDVSVDCTKEQILLKAWKHAIFWPDYAYTIEVWNPYTKDVTVMELNSKNLRKKHEPDVLAHMKNQLDAGDVSVLEELQDFMRVCDRR